MQIIYKTQGTATIEFGLSTQAANGTTIAYSDDFAIQITTINPSDGSPILKKYCSSTTATPTESGGFVLWEGTNSSDTVKAASFAQAVNSSFGQGSGNTTPTLTCVINPSDPTQVLLTQLYGGTDGNTTITYGTNLTTIGTVTSTTLTAGGTGYTGSGPNGTSGGGSGFAGGSTGLASGLSVQFNQTGGVIQNIIGTGGSNRNYVQGTTGVIISGGTSNALLTIATVTKNVNPSNSSAAFTGGTAIFKNTFLNALKSVQTPIYVDYDFKTAPAPSVAVTIQASSSIRGVVYNNTTTYTDSDPVGSVLVDPQGQKQYLDMHPGEDIFISINSIPDITVDDYQIILGENVIITTALAAQSITNVDKLIVDNLSDDTIPPVGSLVTGPEIKAGVVTTLGAVQTAGTGYDPSTTQVLATTGAGGGNLTLTVTTNSSGNVTTAALSNPGTGYSTNNVVTIVGGDNNATVAISLATPLAVLVNDFNPANNQVTFNSNQTITDNSKLTFTTNGILNADTIPVSQQGAFVYNTMSLGVDTIWDSIQNQFYDGEYSGSELQVETKEQYNPYRKVKPNSIPIEETTVTVNTANGLASSGMAITNTGTPSAFDFSTVSGTSGKRETYLGITALELIPYQNYKVTYTADINNGGGLGCGFFPENYGYNNTSYGFYSQIVSSYTGAIGGTNTGYSLANNVATTPPGTRVPTVVGGTSGTGYVDGTFETTGGNGAGQTVTITTTAGVIQTVTLVNPGSGYIVGDVLTVVGGNNDGEINPGAGGVEVDIIELKTTGLTGTADAVSTGTITAGTQVSINNVSGNIEVGSDVVSVGAEGGTKVTGGNLTSNVILNKDIVVSGGQQIQFSISGRINTNGIEIVNGGNGLYQQGDIITITGGDGTAKFTINEPTGASLNGVTNSDTGEDFIRPAVTTPVDYEFTFKYLPPSSGDTSINGRYSLGWYATSGGFGSSVQGTVSNITVTGIGGIYENVEAPIFLTQQDRGYDNQADYQNMGPKDALGNVIGGSPTIIGSISGPIPVSSSPKILSTTVGTSNGVLLNIAGNGSQGGTGAQFKLATSGTQFTITKVTCTAAGTGYIPGDTITIPAASLTGGAIGTVTTDLILEVTSTGIVKPGIPKNGGTGYVTATNVATTSTGGGTGLKVDITAVAGVVTLVSINAASYPLSDNYSIGDEVIIGTGGATFTILSTKGEIDLIQNTQSVIYNNSDYNPLSNNVNTNRSSSNKYILSYGATQSVPNNFDLVVTASYFPTSPSGTFPELADVPDSNYTMPSSVNARYAGTKLKSLTYNFFTPSGSVGPSTNILSATGFVGDVLPNVAKEFIDGSITSSFQQTPLGAGSASWAGDSKQNRGESTIDKHPIYMARFENSYEQLNFYDSYQFNIDQLIQVPFEDIAGSEITPNSITIDGSNKK